MAFACPTSTGFYNECFGMPSKFGSILNKECPTTFERNIPSSYERSFGGYPWANSNFGGAWNNTYERFGGAFPWNNNNTFERFGAYPWANTFGDYERFCGAFPWANTYERFGGAYPWANNFGGFERFGGALPWTNMDNTWAFNNNTLCATSFRPSSENEYFTMKNPIRYFPDGTRGLWLCFDLRGYKPEECTVTVNKAERAIIVEAAHDLKDKEFGVTRKFYRKFVLPEYMSKVDITKIELKAFFGPDSLFYIEGVLPKMSAEECSSWPAYPYTVAGWWNPNWSNAGAWNNNNTWTGANTWNNNKWNNWNNACNFSGYSNYDSKPVACKSI